MSCVGKIIKTTNQLVSNINEQLKAVAKNLIFRKLKKNLKLNHPFDFFFTFIMFILHD